MEDWEQRHSWVAGIMYVHDEDLDSVARERQRRGETVECERCEKIYVPGQEVGPCGMTS